MAKEPETNTEDKYLQTLKEIRRLQKSVQEDGEGKQAAINRLLERRRLIDEDLALLGHTSTPPKRTAPKAKSGATGPSGNYKADQQCKVCNIAGHNTRAHNRHPDKFTAAELAAKGWQVPA